MASARAGYEVVTGIQRVSGRHLSCDGVKSQELVTLEAVVAFKPPQGRSAIPNSRPGTFLLGSCGKVPEPLAVTLEEEDTFTLAFSTVAFHSCVWWVWDSRKLFLEQLWIPGLFLFRRIHPDFVFLDQEDTVRTTECSIH
jgi:hypothetical protein